MQIIYCPQRTANNYISPIILLVLLFGMHAIVITSVTYSVLTSTPMQNHVQFVLINPAKHFLHVKTTHCLAFALHNKHTFCLEYDGMLDG